MIVPLMFLLAAYAVGKGKHERATPRHSRVGIDDTGGNGNREPSSQRSGIRDPEPVETVLPIVEKTEPETRPLNGRETPHKTIAEPVGGEPVEPVTLPALPETPPITPPAAPEKSE